MKTLITKNIKNIISKVSIYPHSEQYKKLLPFEKSEKLHT